MIRRLFHTPKFRFKVNYVLLCPSNKPAQDKCNEIMNDNIDDRINNFFSMSCIIIARNIFMV